MRLLQLFLLIIVGLFLRRWYRSLKRRLVTDPRRTNVAGPAETQAGLEDLTQQDIADADYEEIP